MDFIVNNINYILIVAGFILCFLFGLNKSISGAFKSIWDVVVSVVSFFANALREPDNNGGNTGKTSASRIILFYVVYNIITMGWAFFGDVNKKIPAEWMTMFWISGGLYMLIKVYNAASPQFQALIDAWSVKWGGLTLPPKEPPITKIETTQETKVQ